MECQSQLLVLLKMTTDMYRRCGEYTHPASPPPLQGPRLLRYAEAGSLQLRVALCQSSVLPHCQPPKYLVFYGCARQPMAPETQRPVPEHTPRCLPYQDQCQYRVESMKKVTAQSRGRVFP